MEEGTEVLEPAAPLNCESEGEQGHSAPESGEVALENDLEFSRLVEQADEEYKQSLRRTRDPIPEIKLAGNSVDDARNTKNILKLDGYPH